MPKSIKSILVLLDPTGEAVQDGGPIQDELAKVDGVALLPSLGVVQISDLEVRKLLPTLKKLSSLRFFEEGGLVILMDPIEAVLKFDKDLPIQTTMFI